MNVRDIVWVDCAQTTCAGKQCMAAEQQTHMGDKLCKDYCGLRGVEALTV